MIVIVSYTLLNSYGMQLVTDKHFKSKAEVLSTGTDVLTVKRLVDKEPEQKKVKEQMSAKELLKEVDTLEAERVQVYEVRDI